MISVVILGLGNIGTHLYNAFSELKNVSIVMVYNRTETALLPLKNSINTTTDISNLPNADIYIISTTDDSIANISSQLVLENKLVVHTSGSVAIAALNDKNRKGSFYPLQTFSKGATVNFKEIPICIEAENNADETLLLQLAKSVSNSVHKISSEQRKSIHLAAVFVNNFSNHMYQVGQEICEENKVPFSILSPLIQETVTKLHKLSPYDAQTGPAKRNDIGTMQRQLTQLTNNTHKEIYSVISKSITNTYGKKL
ncbi:MULTISPECIES: Rossmann-like and DUF2520 domain-containing protein [unclassified Cellulophaga]|uniref:Rossmann-like and DUF2520 domain-containing protein n=1 Tax=unclassified Cellulophaga TaxID=2634405 RepID=UPI0026E35A22|nr:MULTISPECIES: DUF2520 domain-containing protein [unclassified Cellulophaga]MDO6490926.1 DUF2520 domain-containing protein [Cellulophaga sp. 2_MG-2023]MDO6493880.1 DUF2520 domain-containing protein [Cellulophaga sp. 3_MG-2023]